MTYAFAGMPFMNLWAYSASRLAQNLSQDWLRDIQRHQRDAFNNWQALLQSCTPDFRPRIEVLPPEMTLTAQERHAMPFLRRV